MILQKLMLHSDILCQRSSHPNLNVLHHQRNIQLHLNIFNKNHRRPAIPLLLPPSLMMISIVVVWLTVMLSSMMILILIQPLKVTLHTPFPKKSRDYLLEHQSKDQPKTNDRERQQDINLFQPPSPPKNFLHELLIDIWIRHHRHLPPQSNEWFPKLLLLVLLPPWSHLVCRPIAVSKKKRHPERQGNRLKNERSSCLEMPACVHIALEEFVEAKVAEVLWRRFKNDYPRGCWW